MVTRTLHLLAAIVLLAIASLASAGVPERRVAVDREWVRGRQAEYCRLFDATKLTSFEGTVTKVRYFAPGRSATDALVLTVELADGAKMSVHLGPAWFLRAQGIEFQVNDLVSVIGSRVEFHREKIVVAVEVTRGMATVKLRTQEGTPLWWSVAQPNT